MQSNTKIKVVGIGGSGSNAVSRMMKCKIKGVELISINTDAQDLQRAYCHKRLRIGREITKGLGAGMNPDVGQRGAEEQREEIEDLLRGADIVFVTCGLGGGTGSGAISIVSDIAKKQGSLTIAIVTRPFSFEGIKRMEIAENVLKQLKNKVDTLITISNDKLLSILEPKTTVSNAFWICDEILRQAVQGISDLIVLPGIINIDFADVKSIMKDSGSALFGIGKARGPERAKEAARKALNSPLLDISYKGAKGVLFNVSGDSDISLSEVDEIAKIITEEVSSQAKVIFGAIQDEKLQKGEIKVTVVATGF
ncbi:MAG: cell division protein FtsZ [Candidatus Nealsonbacteria bacterium]